MADSILDAISYFERLPVETSKAAQLAINQVAQRGALKLIRSGILDEIAFPKDYLVGDRLGITQYAKPGNLEAVITARDRPTSLARFAAGQPIGSKIGVRVSVGKGRTTSLKKAWLVRLNRGEQRSPDSYNVGLAVRVKPGDSISHKKTAHQSWLVPGSVALLYGPSVNQVFKDISGEVAEPISILLQTEFLRQLERFT